jgi:hypothetical protein
LGFVLLAALFVMTGCDSKSSSGGGMTTTEANPYEGDATVEGSVSLNGLSSTDRSLLSSAPATRVISASTSDELVALFVLDETGDMVSTGTSCTVSEGTYSCPNVADGYNYVVRYLKKAGEGRVLEMRTNAPVAKGSKSAKADVDPVSTLVVDSIVKAVEETLTGLSVSADQVSELVSGIKEAVESSVRSLVEQGAIMIPSLVAETDSDLETLAGTKSENDKTSDVSGSVLSDDNVLAHLGAAKVNAQGAALAKMTHAEKIRAIFDQMMEDGGAPEWMVLFLADRYTSIDASVDTIGELTTLIKGSLEVAGGEELTWLGLQESDIDLAAVKTAMESDALSEAKTAIVRYHDLKTKSDKTQAEMEELSAFPAIVGELFPKSFAQNMMAGTKFQNMGQAVVYTVFLTDIFAQEKVVAQVEGQVDYGEKLKNAYLVDFNPFDLFSALGFSGSTAANYPGVFLDRAEIRSERMWDDSQNKEVITLEARIELTSAEWMGQTPTITNAKLTYPKASGGSGQTSMSVETPEGDPWAQLRVSIWPDECDSGCEPDTDNAVTDFIGGTYTVTANINGKSHTFTINDVFVLENALQVRPSLISPREYPRWYEGIDESERQAEWEAFWASGGPTVFAPNNGDKLDNPTFKWRKADLGDLEMPENIRAGYRIFLSRFYLPDSAVGGNEEEKREWCHQQSWEICNEEMYNSWWDDRIIFANSFTLPVSLVENAAGEEYHVGVQLVFVDKNTRREVAQGGDSHTSFTVGEPTIPNDATEVGFSGNISGTLPDGAKLALIGEKWTLDGGGEATTIKVVDASTGDYNLTTTVGDINNTLNDNYHINVIVFVDEAGGTADAFDPWDPDTNTADRAYWPDRWMWVERWGEFRISTDNGEESLSSVKISDDGHNTVSGFDFTLQ